MATESTDIIETSPDAIDATFRRIGGERKRGATLIAWWRALNNWDWPREIPNPEGVEVIGNPRRNALMRAIERELGRRVIHGRKVL